MPIKSLPLPSRAKMQSHIVMVLSRYWSRSSFDFSNLPITAAQLPTISGPLRLQSISLPDWGEHLGVEGGLLVPVEACSQGDNWEQVDWWFAAFLLLECWHERNWELNHGSIHSYSFRLKGWDARAWDRAWVNRIGLFLRCWGARISGKTEEELFGALPQAQVLMTHDVDSVEKTLAIRLKQGAFNIYNAGRHLLKNELKKAAEKVCIAARFFLGAEDWWTFDTLLEIERQAGIVAQFNFYADPRRKNIKRWFLDPNYDIRMVRIRKLIREIVSQQGIIGIHPTFDAWNSEKKVSQQKKLLVAVTERPITRGRQHWLRFSWQRTWVAQENAGLKHDATLMFNDRAGFRGACALSWRPWNHEKMLRQSLVALPTVLMDSHFYDYLPSITRQARKSLMRQWLHEVFVVGGEVAVLWHPHTLTTDFGWRDGFMDLLDILGEKSQ